MNLVYRKVTNDGYKDVILKKNISLEVNPCLINLNFKIVFVKQKC